MESYIFLVGRSDSHHAVVNAIRRLGYKPGIFQDITVPLDDPSKFDVIIPVDFSATPLDYELPANIAIAGLQCTYENYVSASATIGKQLKLPTISEESALACTDKLLMRTAFAQDASQFSPKFATASSLNEVIEFANVTGYPVMIKPTNLVKSLLVLRCDDEQQLRHNFTYALEHVADLYKKYNVHNRTPQLIIEQFVTGKSCSIAAFVDHSGTPHFCEGIVGLTTAREHGADDNYLYARTLPLELDDAIRSLLFKAAEAGIKALKMASTAAHVELIYTDTSVSIIEIGARIGGYRPRMYASSYGLDLHEQELMLSLGKFPNLSANTQGQTCVIELFPDTLGKFQSIAKADLIQSLPSLQYFAVKPEAGEFIGKANQGYKAAGIVILHNTDAKQFASDVAFVNQNAAVITN